MSSKEYNSSPLGRLGGANFLTTIQDRFVTEGGIKERMFQARTTSSILNSQLSRSLVLPSTQKSTFHTMICTNHAFILTNHSFIYTNKTFIYSFWCPEVKSPAYIYQFPSLAISAFVGKLIRNAFPNAGMCISVFMQEK